MTGRLDEIDLATDVALFAVYLADDPPSISDLVDIFAALDTDPFPFDDVPETDDDVGDALTKLFLARQVDSDDEGATFRTTNAGRGTISELTQKADQARLDAIEDAVQGGDADA